MIIESKYITATRNHIEFERGKSGIVPCPPIQTGKFTVHDTQAMYWSFRPSSEAAPYLIISYFEGNISPEEGKHDVYDIDGNISLVIHTVTQSNEGEYSYSYKPRWKAPEEGSLDVSERGEYLK